MRCLTDMVEVVVLGRAPRTSNAPAPVLTMIESKRSWSWPAKSQSPLLSAHFFISKSPSLAILRSGRRSVAALAGLLSARASTTTRVATATAQSKTTVRFVPKMPTIDPTPLHLKGEAEEEFQPSAPRLTLERHAV